MALRGHVLPRSAAVKAGKEPGPRLRLLSACSSFTAPGGKGSRCCRSLSRGSILLAMSATSSFQFPQCCRGPPLEAEGESDAKVSKSSCVFALPSGACPSGHKFHQRHKVLDLKVTGRQASSALKIGSATPQPAICCQWCVPIGS